MFRDLICSFVPTMPGPRSACPLQKVAASLRHSRCSSLSFRSPRRLRAPAKTGACGRFFDKHFRHPERSEGSLFKITK